MTQTPRCLKTAPGILLVALLCCGGQNGHAQSGVLPVEQAQLAERFERLENLALRIAELVAADNPDRAKQLRDAIARSRDLALGERFNAVVTLLEQERFAAASRNQTELSDNLDTLLGLLLADPREARLAAERRRLREAIKEVSRLARRQRSLRSDTLDKGDPAEGQPRQERIAEDTQRLQEKLHQRPDNQQKDQPRDQQDPHDQADAERRAAQRLADAKQAMDRAAQRMSQGEPSGATAEQSQAQRELERAKQELEEALRQTREEEQTRMLTRLATRLRRILGEQAEINRLTIEVQGKFGREATIEKLSATTGLAKREDGAAETASRAIRLLVEDGKSIAFVEVLSQAHEDMHAVSKRLVSGATGAITVAIEQDIIHALEDAISAVDAKLAEKANKQQDSQQPGQQAEQQERSLVDMLAELRMLKSLQARILQRTERWELQRASGGVTDAGYAEAMDRLSKRQQRAIEAAESLAEPE